MPITIASNATTATTVGVSNLIKQNTPDWLETIGNICLLIGVIGSSIALVPSLVAIPVIAAIVPYTVAAGLIGKTVTKLFGETAITS